jgi:hypothetical protein
MFLLQMVQKFLTSDRPLALEINKLELIIDLFLSVYVEELVLSARWT